MWPCRLGTIYRRAARVDFAAAIATPLGHRRGPLYHRSAVYRSHSDRGSGRGNLAVYRRQCRRDARATAGGVAGPRNRIVVLPAISGRFTTCCAVPQMRSISPSSTPSARPCPMTRAHPSVEELGRHAIQAETLDRRVPFGTDVHPCRVKHFGITRTSLACAPTGIPIGKVFTWLPTRRTGRISRTPLEV